MAENKYPQLVGSSQISDRIKQLEKENQKLRSFRIGHGMVGRTGPTGISISAKPGQPGKGGGEAVWG